MNSKKTVEDSYRVKSAERIFDILDCFTFNTKELSLSEIASKTGLHKTTAKRLIANLLARGYLRQDPSSRRYQLGLRLFELGGKQHHFLDWRNHHVFHTVAHAVRAELMSRSREGRTVF